MNTESNKPKGDIKANEGNEEEYSQSGTMTSYIAQYQEEVGIQNVPAGTQYIDQYREEKGIRQQ